MAKLRCVNGSSQYLVLATGINITTTQDFSIRFRAPADTNSGDMRIIGGSTLFTQNVRIIIYAGGEARLYGDAGALEKFAVGFDISVDQEGEFRRTSGQLGFYIGEVLQGSTVTSTMSLTGIKHINVNFNSYSATCNYEYLEIDVAGSPVLALEPDSSDTSDTGAQPILVDTVSANNATGVNFATDGSAWVDAAVYTLTSSPASLQKGGAAGNIVVSNPTTAPTSGNTVVTLITNVDDTGLTMTLGTIVGNTIPVSLAAASAVRNGFRYSFLVSINSQEVIGGSCQILVESGYSSTDLDTPSVADGSCLEGPTNGGVSSLDQVVYASTTTPSGSTVTVDSAGTYIIDPFPTQAEVFSRYVIKENNSVGAAADYTITVSGVPDAFSFTAVTGANRNTLYTATAAISGAGLIDGVTTLPVTNGEISVDSGSTYVTTPVTYSAGTTLVRATVTSSGLFSTEETQSPSVNGVQATYSVTTRAAVVPTISSQPVNDSAVDGASFSFTVAGTNLASGQWYAAAGNSAISGETSTTYTATATLGDNGKTFYYIGTSADGVTVQSNTVSLSVTAASGNAINTINKILRILWS